MANKPRTQGERKPEFKVGDRVRHKVSHEVGELVRGRGIAGRWWIRWDGEPISQMTNEMYLEHIDE